MGSWQKGICSLEPSRGNFDYSRSSPLVLTEALFPPACLSSLSLQSWQFKEKT